MTNTQYEVSRKGKWGKARWIIAIILALVVVGLLSWVIHKEQVNGPEAGDTVNHYDLTPQKFETYVRGSIVCLALKAGTPPNTATTSHANNIDCVKGLKGDDGKTYALNTTALGGPEISMPVGKRVTAVGTYQVNNSQASESNYLVYDGVLVVRAMSTN